MTDARPHRGKMLAWFAVECDSAQRVYETRQSLARISGCRPMYVTTEDGRRLGREEVATRHAIETREAEQPAAREADLGGV